MFSERELARMAAPMFFGLLLVGVLFGAILFVGLPWLAHHISIRWIP